MLPKLRTSFFLVPLLIYCGAALAEQETGRYLAVYVDGERVQSDKISGWYSPEPIAKLDGKPLLDPKKPLRWFRDLQAKRGQEKGIRAGYVEMFGGDRFPGIVSGYLTSTDDANRGGWGQAQLLVQPTIDVGAGATQKERYGILERFVRRVVWGSKSRQEFEPGTLFYRDGRIKRFRSLRWGDGHVKLLTEKGLQQAAFEELAEIHLHVVDQWNLMCEEYALLEAKPGVRLMQMESVGGLIALTAPARFYAVARNSTSNPGTWYHMIQPVWCTHPLWIRFTRIKGYKLFSPDEILLSRLHPVHAQQRSLLGGGWHWQLNQTVQETPLYSSEQLHGWGFGVHAFCQLEFELPSIAKSFRTQIGLARSAANGGCAIARVYNGSATGNPLFQSKHIIGSRQGVDTGDLVLPESKDKKRLVLQAHPAHNNRPPGADPLDIRDSLNWLDPIVKLDEKFVYDEIIRRIGHWIPAWKGWTVDQRSTAQMTMVNLPPGFRESRNKPIIVGVHLTEGTLVLKRSYQLEKDDSWLVLGVYKASGKDDKHLIAVRINGQHVGTLEVPTGKSGLLDPLTIPVESYRGEEIQVELIQIADASPQPLVWSSISIEKSLPTVRTIFEDSATFDPPLDQEKSKATLIHDDIYSGQSALRVPSGESVTIRFDDSPVSVQSYPVLGEFQYIRFAVRKRESLHAVVELLHKDSDKMPFRYDLGVGKPAFDNSTRVWQEETNNQWSLYTRGVKYDMRDLKIDDIQLTGIKFTSTGKGDTLFDHVYFGRTERDFEKTEWQNKIKPQEDQKRAANSRFVPAVDMATTSLVALKFADRQGVGVFVDSEGWIATTAYLAGTPGQKVSIQLPGGQEVPGETYGIDRDHDAGLIRVSSDFAGPWPEPTFSQDRGEVPHRGRCVVVAPWNDQKPEQGPLQYGTALTSVYGLKEGPLWVSFEFQEKYSGAPLMTSSPRIVSLVSRRYGPGGTLSTPLYHWVDSMNRLKKKEVWGKWPTGLEPTMKLHVGPHQDALTVLEVYPAGVAEKAGIQVDDQLLRIDGKNVKTQAQVVEYLSEKMYGDKVKLDMKRANQNRTVELILERP